jgi:hypothetical protein
MSHKWHVPHTLDQQQELTVQGVSGTSAAMWTLDWPEIVSIAYISGLSVVNCQGRVTENLVVQIPRRLQNGINQSAGDGNADASTVERKPGINLSANISRQYMLERLTR